MPALQFTPGPIHLYVRFRNKSIADYLGTCVVAPEPEATKYKIPVMNDLSGRSVPFQLVQDGENHIVLATTNRFDYAVYRAIRALDNGSPAGQGVLGAESGLARGTLVIGVSDFELILVNGYYGTAAAGSGTAPLILNAGRRYYSSNLMKYKESTAGTRVQEIALAIGCENVFIPATRGFGLYSETDLGVLGPIS